MRPAALKLRPFARRLLTYEAASAKTAQGKESAAFRVCEELRAPLSTLAGVAGFRSLLSRALAVASDEVRWLKAVHVNAEGSLEGFDKVRAQLSPDEFDRGEVALVAQLVGLLVTFIGEALTFRLLKDVWPQISMSDLNSETERDDG